MKEFVKTMLAVICAMIVMQIVSTLFFFMFFGSLLVSGSGNVAIPRNGVLDLDLSTFVLGEQTKEMDMSSLGSLGNLSSMNTVTLGLADAVQAIDAAAADIGVQYILLRPDGATAGMGQVEELRAALARFRESGKAVIAYLENPGNGSFYLSTVADKVYLSAHHGGSPQLLGLSSSMIFLKDLLDKVGVHMQLIRHGKYKSAGEMYIKNTASPENREQHQVMINSAWKTYSDAICAARGLTEETLNGLIDNLKLNLPEDFLEAGLVDALMDRQALVNKLCTLSGVQEENQLQLIPFAAYAQNRAAQQPLARAYVAVIYADGEIVDGDDYQQVAGDRFARAIDQLRSDQTVKAAVLRVNSPGGSVAASEKIRAALDRLQAEKPVVASFGNYAASGGYWISNGCQRIFSDANTITGSIGVFSMIPELSHVTRKVGVKVETVGTHKHSDMFSLMRPFDAAEQAYMQASVEDIYERFVNLVAQGRDMEPARVDELAQGRVWLGTDALENGLVDEIGTLQDAIAYAASLANLTSADGYGLLACPEQPTFLETLLEGLGQNNQAPAILSDTPFEAFSTALGSLKEVDPAKAYARLPYAFAIR